MSRADKSQVQGGPRTLKANFLVTLLIFANKQPNLVSRISIFENNLVKTANFNIGQKVKTFVREVVLYILCFK